MEDSLVVWMITDSTNYVHIGLALEYELTEYTVRSLDDVLRDYYDNDISVLQLRFYTKKATCREMFHIVDVVNNYKRNYEQNINISFNEYKDCEISNSKMFPKLIEYLTIELNIQEV